VNLAVIGAVFAVIFVGELPDKTMVASLEPALEPGACAPEPGARAPYA
jgi:hypothetical protein